MEIQHYSENGVQIMRGEGLRAAQAAITAAFEKARMQTFEHRERVNAKRIGTDYVKPSDPVVPSEPVLPIIDTQLESFNRFVEQATAGLEILDDSAPKKPAKPLVSLTKQAAPILANIGTVPLRKKDVPVHVIEGDYSKVNLRTLLQECDQALGLKPKPTITPDALKCNLAASETKKKRFWQR